MKSTTRFHVASFAACWLLIGSSGCGAACPSNTTLQGDTCKADNADTANPDNAGHAAAADDGGADASVPRVARDAGVSPVSSGAGGHAVVGGSGGLGAGGSNDAGNALGGSGGQVAVNAGPPCSMEGAMRCATGSAGSRERCTTGVWLASACAAGQVCTTTAGSPACQPTVAACKGNASKMICDAQGMMLMCNTDGTAMPIDNCQNTALCMAGLTAGSCGTCMPGSHQCLASELRVCPSDGHGYMSQIDCKSPALCNAEQGVCKTPSCQSDDITCDGDTLKQCNQTLTGWDDISSCGAGLCDATNKRCRMCTAGQRKCSGDSVLTCDAQGLSFSASACDTTAPHCSGAGACVACRDQNDCKAGSCQVASCSSAGVCSTQPAPNGLNLSGIADGSVVEQPMVSPIYVVFGGAKFQVPDPDTLNRLYGGTTVQDISALTLAVLGSIPVTGTTLKEDGGDAIWRVEDGVRRHIVTFETLMSNCGGPAVVKVVPAGTLSAIPIGAEIP